MNKPPTYILVNIVKGTPKVQKKLHLSKQEVKQLNLAYAFNGSPLRWLPIK